MPRNRISDSKTFSKFGCCRWIVLFFTITPILILLRYHYQRGFAENGVRSLLNATGLIHYDRHVKTVTYIEIVDNHLLLKNNEDNEDFCATQWTDEDLIGRCWGLTTSINVPDITSPAGELAALSAKGCQKLCCDLGQKCITWQYWGASMICKIGKIVRVGHEHGDSPRWCEPQPPQTWVGGKRNLVTSPLLTDSNPDWKAPLKCDWGGNESGQCFGMGPERLNSTKGRLSANECATECCGNPHCRLWQHLTDRGCFYNNDRLREAPHCDQYKGVYTGGRKKHKKTI